MPTINRGEVWLTDLGIAAKVRPCLVLSVSLEPQDRVLVTLVPHMTSVRGTRFEIALPKLFLKTGAFDAQGLITVAPSRLLRKLGELQPAEMLLVEKGISRWLGLSAYSA
ncbi:MAG: type II toxin-antitoxin system PemK/MazF family toxin [Planctomycetota bacterium]